MRVLNALPSIDWTVAAELRHIPKGRKGSLQRILRNEYTAYRKIHRELGAELPPWAALAQAIVNIQRTSPEFAPRFDVEFFLREKWAGRPVAAAPS